MVVVLWLADVVCSIYISEVEMEFFEWLCFFCVVFFFFFKQKTAYEITV